MKCTIADQMDGLTMKNFLTTKVAFCLTIMLTALSCSKEIPVPEEPEVSLPDIISAEVEGTTKMNIVDYRPVWKLGDEICLAGIKYRCSSTEGIFEKIEGVNDGTTIACYPYSLYQSANKFCLPYEYQQHTDIDFMPMIGYYDETSQKIYFKNLGSVCRFRIKNTAEQTVYTKSFIITPKFQNAASMTTNGKFSVGYSNSEDKTPSIIWDYSGNAKHLPFIVIRFNGVITLAPGAYHDVYAFLPPYDYTDLNLRTEAYLTEECTGQVYFSNTNKGAATVERNNWYDIAVKSASWNEGVRGNGTPKDPFELGSQADFSYINQQIKSSDDVAKNYFAQANYVLTKDVEIQEWNEAIACSMESSGVKSFNGVFDGQGHTFRVISSAQATRPLFYDVTGGVIKNLIIDGTFKHDRSGDAIGTVTFSPFFFSARSLRMVACVFKGSVEIYYPNHEISRVTTFGAMNNSCYLVGSAYNNTAESGLYQAVMLQNDTSKISDSNVRGVYQIAEANIEALNTALTNWNNSSDASEEAKTDYRYKWENNTLVLTPAN